MKCLVIGLLMLGTSIAAPNRMTAQGAQAEGACPEREVMGSPSARFIRGPKPVYPATLRGRRITGWVVLRFVVRCTGRADSTTVVVLRATDTAFVRPAIDAVLRAEYRPAEVRGRQVAVPVEQAVRFTPKSPA